MKGEYNKRDPIELEKGQKGLTSRLYSSMMLFLDMWKSSIVKDFKLRYMGYYVTIIPTSNASNANIC